VPDSRERRFSSAALIWIGCAALVVLFYVALRRSPDGTERAALAQFVGRFHPLLVHVPIALILLVALFEIASAFPRGGHLRSATGFILGLATAAAVIAGAQ
jgi:hypothetical protein